MMKLLSILVIASYFQISVICSKGRVSNIQISKVFHEITTKSTNGPGACVAKNCYKESIVCTSDPSCFEATQCNAECLTAPDIDSCNLLCELNYGFNNTAYTVLLDCMVENGCLPQSPYDGICLATFDDVDASVTRLQQLAGQWWILKGLNCGQNDTWYGGFDYYPCQSDNFVLDNDGNKLKWIDKIAYCGGNNNTCTTPLLHTSANVSIDHPGVMHHDYLDAPLLPQTEDWIVLSHFDDWMLYIYCGFTPAGGYAGGSVVSRVSKVITDIPVDIEENFRVTAKKFGFDYDEMCVSDCSTCLS